jgi:hypothetical protein
MLVPRSPTATVESESWISDRTGHRSSQMIARYKCPARTFMELELGELAMLDEAIPELLIGPGLGQTHKKGASQFPEKRHDSDWLRGPDLNRRPSGYETAHGDRQGAGTREFPQKPEDTSPSSSPIVEPKDQSRPNQDPIEVALADALMRASVARQWDVVAMLARELQARREARARVVELEGARKRRGGP